MMIVDEELDGDRVGGYLGQCKWFNDRLGYGFITVVEPGVHKGKDIFVHHSGIRPLNSNYKTLLKGEYVSFDIVDGHNGSQAVGVTGVLGGGLMCDTSPVTRRYAGSTPRRFVQQ